MTLVSECGYVCCLNVKVYPGEQRSAPAVEERLHARTRKQTRKRRKRGTVPGAVARVLTAATGQVVLNLLLCVKFLDTS